MRSLNSASTRFMLAATFFALASISAFDGTSWMVSSALAQQAPTADNPAAKSEQDDFEAAKALGTVEAWKAFLTHYSSGFRADLARAYLKKLEGAAGTPPATSAPQAATPAAPPPAPPPAVVSSSVPDVNGVIAAIYDGGIFQMGAQGNWTETRDNGIKVEYSELSRSQDGIELQAAYEPDVFIKLDVQGRAILRRSGSSPERAIHEIRKVERTSQGASMSEQAAYANVCQGQETLRSRESREPAKLRFVNGTGTTVLLQWIDFNGKRKDYATLRAGDEVTQDTFITHPWVVNDINGRCREIYLPAPGNSVARLLPMGSGAGQAIREEPVYVPKREVRRDPPPPLKCGKNYRKINGECVMMQNCGANAYRSPEGDCYCNKGYRMVNGSCQWKTDKQGFEVKPWTKPGCRTMKVQCSNGNNEACANYEANCQVN